MHEECIEQLDIGTKWQAEMCLSCQQRSTRKLRVISAIELRRGNRWDQDERFKNFLDYLVIGTGYGESRNKDLNELELLFARAVINGLKYRRDAEPASPTDDADAGSPHSGDPPGEPTPIAEPAAPREEEPPQEALSSRVQAGRP